MPWSNRSPQKRFSKAYRSNPYSPTKGRTPDGPSKFDPDIEGVDSEGPHASPDPRRAHEDPYHYYTMRSGKHRGKTMAKAAIEPGDYLEWMKEKHYDNLDENHVIRRALDQWEESLDPNVWKLPKLSTAPDKFREAPDRIYHIYMSERFLRKYWNGITPDELETAGAASRISELSKTKSKKFALFHVYEYAKEKGGMTEAEADEAANGEINRILANRAQFKNFKDRCASCVSGGETYFCSTCCE